eukprot:CAMPEP_0113530594 /NCGR_PEP_ID=MMETSP0015_2-20120614/3031_1 /TAXON_ID=2838 /ORGANISM="Odontella" /LENGTH=173 /DNA_ID=CAMNT_0000429343 /DNA_START=140 /DNA_END=658 /DNA_ORIENTATION=+ /assembly_acc=CAM_ASM_000160
MAPDRSGCSQAISSTGCGTDDNFTTLAFFKAFVGVDWDFLAETAVTTGIKALGEKVPVFGDISSAWLINDIGLGPGKPEQTEYQKQVLKSIEELGEKIDEVKEGIEGLKQGQKATLDAINNLGLQNLLIQYEKSRIVITNAFETWTIYVSKLSSKDQQEVEEAIRGLFTFYET